MRPNTLAEVAKLALGGDSFDRCLANFLDEFYYQASARALADSPPLMGTALGELGQVQDAYLAATAEELARRFDLPLPAWTAGEERKLHRPWFASPLGALRAVLLLESPPRLPLPQSLRQRECPEPGLEQPFKTAPTFPTP